MPRSRSRQYKRKTSRVEFLLNSEHERDAVIMTELDRLKRRGEASEFIKQVLFKAIAGEHQEMSRNATADDIKNLRDDLLSELVELRRTIANLKAVQVTPSGGDDAQDERHEQAANRLKKLNFNALGVKDAD